MRSLIIRHLPESHPDTSIPDPHQDTFSKCVLGFWMYLMTDCILFATLFITYAVLHDNNFGGPTSQELFSLSTAFIETMILLFSSVTCGLGILASLRNDKTKVLGWLLISFLLGASFVALEINEFHHFVQEGHSWTQSAFLSTFFALVGTHGLHVTCGLLWMTIMMLQVYFIGINIMTFRRLVLFSMFWHFLDVVWVFIFTFVYLMGVI